jgi:hypothetical protein
MLEVGSRCTLALLGTNETASIEGTIPLRAEIPALTLGAVRDGGLTARTDLRDLVSSLDRTG